MQQRGGRKADDSVGVGARLTFTIVKREAFVLID